MASVEEHASVVETVVADVAASAGRVAAWRAAMDVAPDALGYPRPRDARLAALVAADELELYRLRHGRPHPVVAAIAESAAAAAAAEVRELLAPVACGEELLAVEPVAEPLEVRSPLIEDPLVRLALEIRAHVRFDAIPPAVLAFREVLRIAHLVPLRPVARDIVALAAARSRHPEHLDDDALAEALQESWVCWLRAAGLRVAVVRGPAAQPTPYHAAFHQRLRIAWRAAWGGCDE